MSTWSCCGRIVWFDSLMGLKIVETDHFRRALFGLDIYLADELEMVMIP